MGEIQSADEQGGSYSLGDVLFLTSLVFVVGGLILVATVIVMRLRLVSVYGSTLTIRYAMLSVAVVAIGVILYGISSRIE